jgi:pSer/pThr/pTyr-binding forkhead associated (FHA) protein
MAGASLVVVVLSGVLVGALGIWLFRRGQASPRPAPATLAPAPSAAAPAVAPAQAAPPKTAPDGTTEPVSAATPYLEFEGTQGGTRRFHIGAQPITVGRAPDSDVCITETFPGWDSVSRRHARILREVRHGQTRFIVEDLNSRNGVFVNGRRTGRNVLRDGWRVSLGRLTFTYRSNEGSPRERSAAP